MTPTVQPGTGISPEDIEAHLQTLLSSPRFASAARLSGFLRFVCQKTLSGQAGEIKEYLVATEVYGRNPSVYDPKIDAIVRVEASRLRTRLREYYENEGKHSPLRIEIPKGAYVPGFHEVTKPALETERPAPVDLPPPDVRKPVWGKTLFVSLGILIAVGLIAAAYVRYIAMQAEAAVVQGQQLLGAREGFLMRGIDSPTAPPLRETVLAIQALRRAVSLNPRSARAQANLAWAYFIGSEQDSQYGSMARASIRQALALDPNSADAHAVAAYVAYYGDWDFPTALREISRAIDLDATSDQLYRLHNESASVLGRFNEAAVRLQEGRARFPNSGPIAVEQAKLFYRTGDIPGLLSQAGEIQKRMPESYLASWFRALALERRDQLPEAEAELRTALRRLPDQPRVKASLGHVLAREGKRDEALQVVDFFTRDKKTRAYSPSSVALIYAGLGQTKEAIEWLETARTSHDRNLPLVAADPRFLKLAHEERFRTLLSQMGLAYQAR